MQLGTHQNASKRTLQTPQNGADGVVLCQIGFAQENWWKEVVSRMCPCFGLNSFDWIVANEMKSNQIK